MEERNLREKDGEKNRLIELKSIKLNDLAEKQVILHDKETKNEELKKTLDIQKQKIRKSQPLQGQESQNKTVQQDGSAGSLRESTVSSKQGEVVFINEEERLRLDRMRNEKFKFITESMASHRIDESNSEYSASIISNHHPKKTNRLSE